MSKVILYSCHEGDYDYPVQDGRLYVKGCDKMATNRMKAKAPKMLPHLYLPEHDVSIWIDASIELKCSITELVEMMGEYSCLLFAHPERTTINQEIEATKTMDSEINRFYHKDKPGRLCKGGVIVRKNSSSVNILNEKWWAEICKGSIRDQLSLPYTLGTIAKIIETEWTFRPYNNKFYKVNFHK